MSSTASEIFENKPLSADEILARVKIAENVKRDSELASILCTDAKNVSNWKKRGTVPYEKLVEYAIRSGVSLDWLILDRGPMKVDQFMVSEPGAIYKVRTNIDVVYRIAADVYLTLQPEGIEISPATFLEVVKTLHRDMLDRGEDSVPAARVAAFLRLAISEKSSD